MIKCIVGTELSNFWYFYGTTIEHMYQSEKAVDPVDRQKILDCRTANDAKHLGRRVKLRADWESVKVEVMLGLLRFKFAPGTELAGVLLKTGDDEIVEGNWWHDCFWGQCNCNTCGQKGENMLGKLLMQVRSELRLTQSQT